MRKIFGYMLAIALGFIPGFFIVFNGVFSDNSGAITERLVSLALVVISFSILGGLFAFFSPTGSWRWGVWVSLPAIIILILYSWKEQGVILLSLAYLILTIFSAVGAAYLASRKK